MLRLSKWTFLLLVVSLPLVRPFNLTLFDMQVPYTDLIFLVSFFFWIVALIRRETSLKTDRLYIYVGLYAAAFTISTFLSVEPRTSFFKLLGEYYLFALCFLAFNLVQDLWFLKHVVTAWLAGTVLTVLASFAGFTLFYLGFSDAGTNYFLSHFGSLPAGNYPRIHALFANANMLCNFINISASLALLAKKTGWIQRTTAIILLAGISFAALFSISPGLGGITLSVGIWFFVIGSKKWYAKPALACGVVLAFAAFAATLVSPDTNNTTQEIPLPYVERKFEPSVRVLVWQDTVQTVRQYPWFGKGTGTSVANVRYEALSGMHQLLLDAHNMWLNVAGQTGLFGLTAFMLLLAFLLKRCSFIVKNSGEWQFVNVALSCAFVGAFMYQGLDGSFEDARHLWVLVGLLAASSVNADGSQTDISTTSKTPLHRLST
jgi:O-antigen ligase